MALVDYLTSDVHTLIKLVPHAPSPVHAGRAFACQGQVTMLALIAAVLIGIYAFDYGHGTPNLLYLGLAFWAAHFAVGIGLPWIRRG